MKSTFLLVTILLVLSVFCSDHLQARGYALLQNTIGSSGYHYSSSTTDVFTYSDSLNGMMMPSGFTRNYFSSSDGDITQWTGSYIINHSVSNLPGGTQYVYECLDNEGAPYYHKTMIYDSSGRLIYKSDDHDFIRQFKLYINPVTGLSDSLVMKLNQTQQYQKFTYSYDSLNRVSTRHKYFSGDSLNWSYIGYSSFEYGSALPHNLSVYEPETLSYDLLYYFVDDQYAITSQYINDLSTGYTNTIQYYLTSSNPLTYSFVDWYLETYKFNNTGKLISVVTDNYPNMSSLSYTWGDYVSVDDVVSVPQLFSLYPNPFDISVKLRLNLEKSEAVAIRIYNPRGQMVRTVVSDRLDKGEHYFDWDGRDAGGKPLGSGIYLIRVRQGNLTYARKVFKL